VEEQSVWSHCSRCGWRLHTDLTSLASNFPESVRFERKHSRVKTVPIHQLTYQGAPASMIRLQSRADTAQLDLIFHAITFALLDSCLQ